MRLDDTGIRLIDELIARATGPMWFRFVLQPVMGLIYAIRDGRKDAQAGRTPYFWALNTDATDRGELLKEGGKAMLRVIGLGVVMDAIYQLTVIKGFRPVELIVIVVLLAFLPYAMLRGIVNRIVSGSSPSKSASAR